MTPPVHALPRLRAGRAAVTAVFALSGAAFGAWVGRIPDVRSAAGLSEAVLGGVLLAMAVGALIGMQAVAPLTRRLGLRRLILCSAAGYGWLLLPIAFAADAVSLAAALLLLGVGAGVLDVAMNAAAVQVERDYGRSVMSSFHASFSVGGLAGAGTAGLLAGADVPVLPGFLATAAVLLVVALVAGRRLPVDAAPPAAGTSASPAPTADRRHLWSLAGIAFVCLMAEGSAADWSGIHLRDDRGASAGTAVAGFVAFSALMTLGRLVGDRVTAALGAQRTVRGGAVLAGAGLLLAVSAPTTALSVVGFAAQGAGLSVLVPVVFSATGALAGDPARNLARVSSLGYLGFIAGPPLVGGLARLTDLPVALGVVGLLLLVTATRARLRAPAGEPVQPVEAARAA